MILDTYGAQQQKPSALQATIVTCYTVLQAYTVFLKHENYKILYHFL